MQPVLRITNASTASIGSSIVAGNTGFNDKVSNCGGGSVPTSVGYNLTDDTAGAACGFTKATDLVNTNPELGALGNNGGPTQTLLPAPSSPAARVIPTGTTLNSVSVCPGTDQRGVSRPVPPATSCTIGAVEAQQVTTAALASSQNPSTAGQSVTYTATVSPTPIGGTVSFTDYGSPITGCSAVALSGSTAVCSATPSTTGAHNIVASYSGSEAFTASSSPTVTQVVTKTPCNVLAGCNLEGLDLANANLAGANLTDTNLNDANLTNANLTGANLTAANLNRANLTGANLTGATVTVDTNFNRVTWSGTTCPDGADSNADGGTCLGSL